jgi:hypothetical protein
MGSYRLDLFEPGQGAVTVFFVNTVMNLQAP